MEANSSTQLLKRKALDRWENEGGRLLPAPIRRETRDASEDISITINRQMHPGAGEQTYSNIPRSTGGR
jgi:hypothetical protein